MASITKDHSRGKKKGKPTWRVQVMIDGRREAIRLGVVTKNQATKIKGHIEELASRRIDGSAPAEDTAHWLNDINPKLSDRLVELRLRKRVIPPAKPQEPLTLGELIQKHKADAVWKALSPSSRRMRTRAFVVTLMFIPPETLVKDITPQTAKSFDKWTQLSKEDGGMGYSISTAATTMAAAYGLLQYAIDSRLLADGNVFQNVPRRVQEGNNVEVTHEDSLRVLAALPDCQARLMFGMCRWGGLRIPSEISKLQWCHIDWERNRMLIHSEKTKNHVGHATRWIPLFPDVKKLLQERWDEEDGDDYVLPRFARSEGSRPRNVVLAALRKIGMEPWPRLFHSLRSTRETELVATFPVHVVCAWLGNSIRVAQKHYLKVRDSDFTQAAQFVAQQVPAIAGNVEKRRTAARSA